MLPVSLPDYRFRHVPFRFRLHTRLLTLLQSGTMAGLLMVTPAWGNSSQQTDNPAPAQSQATVLSAGSRPLLPSRAEIEQHQEFFLLLGGIGIITVSLIRAVNRNRTLREALRRAELAESRLKPCLIMSAVMFTSRTATIATSMATDGSATCSTQPPTH